VSHCVLQWTICGFYVCMDYLWTLYLYGLKFYVVNSNMNFLLLYEISVIVWILYKFSVIFRIFSIFSLKLLIFGGPPAAENKSTIFSSFNFWRLTAWPPKIRLYFRRPESQPPKITYFRRPGPGHRKYSLIFDRFFWRLDAAENIPFAAENNLFSAAKGLFSAASGRRKCL
jgi:hypothetical protein